MTTFAATAQAQLVLAPPVLGPEIKPTASQIERTIQEELERSGIEAVKRTQRTTVRLAKCGNKMSCLAKEGKLIGATHVLHTILAQRGDEVLAQLTILDVHTKKPIDISKAKTTPSSDSIDRTLRGAAHTVALTLAKLPEFASDSIPTEPPSSSPPVAATPPLSAPESSPPAATPPVATPPVASAPTPPPPPSAEDEPSGFKPSARAGGGTKIDPVPTTVETPIAPPPASGPNYLVYGTGAVGIGAAIGGVIALALASSDASKRDSTPQIDVEGRQGLHDSATSKQTAGIALLIGGGVALGAAAIIAIVSKD